MRNVSLCSLSPTLRNPIPVIPESRVIPRITQRTQLSNKHQQKNGTALTLPLLHHGYQSGHVGGQLLAAALLDVARQVPQGAGQIDACASTQWLEQVSRNSISSRAQERSGVIADTTTQTHMRRARVRRSAVIGPTRTPR
jgi:hypothetical protein